MNFILCVVSFFGEQNLSKKKLYDFLCGFAGNEISLNEDFGLNRFEGENYIS